MKPWHVDTLQLPNDSGAVRIEAYGEHHMGCENIAIVPSFPIGGVSRFFATNGSAYYSAHTNSLIIRDACVLLRFNMQSKTLEHFVPPTGWYIGNVEESDAGYHFSLYASFKNSEHRIPFSSGEFAPGFGPVARGAFPSARFSA